MKKNYLIGIVLSSLFYTPILADTSKYMINLVNTVKYKIPSKSKINSKQNYAQVIVVLKSGENKNSFLNASQSINNSNKFTIKKSFSLIASTRNHTLQTSQNALEPKQILVIQSTTLNINELIQEIKNIPGAERVEEDQIVHASERTPDDPKFINLWGLKNNHNPITDINVTSAWDTTTGTQDVVVGIIDTGVDYTHSDLATNIWVNPGEISGDGIDNDGNGYIDDIYGIDTTNNDSNPMDDAGHGTHVAGTIGAEGDNAIGVTGVNWNVKIAACKFLDASGSGWISDATECVSYFNALKQAGTNIVSTNNSWGGGGYNQTFKNSITVADALNILFIAAAGNAGRDNDIYSSYPANYDVANVVSVAATDINGDLADFSNFGATTVDLTAPGVNILSSVQRTCIPDNITTFFTDNFDTNLDKWEFYTYNPVDPDTDIPDEHWKQDNTMYASASYSLSDSLNGNYDNNRTQIARIANNINLSSAISTSDKGVCLSMKIKGETEDYFDPLIIYLSKDGGNNWDYYGEISGLINPDWKEVSFVIPEEFFVSNLQIAIYRKSDYLIVEEGYNIDDVSLESGTLTHNNYTYYNGTSMAAPHVTGAVALLASIDNDLNASERKRILLNTVTHKDEYNNKVLTSGLLNAGAMITALNVNTAPVAHNDTATVTENSSVNIAVLNNDSDADEDTLSISTVGSPANGTANKNGAQITYTPNNDYTGTDSFTYVISDGNGGTATATVNVTVNASSGGSGGGGGGCTYNPHNKSIDLMIIFMMMISLLYPLRPKYLK